MVLRRAHFLVTLMALSCLMIFLTGCVMESHPASEQNPNLSWNRDTTLTLVPQQIPSALNLNETNSSLRKIPTEIRDEIQRATYPLALDKWEFDPVKSDQINVYVYDIRNESEIEGYQGKRIGNYTLHIIHDTEFETTRSEVSTYLMQLRKNPDYQIAHVSMITNSFEDPIGYYAELWCYGSTPQNKKLGGVVIKGWTILVYPMSPPPTPQRTMTNSYNTSS